MDIINLLLALIGLGLTIAVLLWVIGFVVVWTYMAMRFLWPLMVGITLAVLLWRAGYDNLGVIVGLFGIGGAWIWLKRATQPIEPADDPGRYEETEKDILRDIRDKLDRR